MMKYDRIWTEDILSNVSCSVFSCLIYGSCQEYNVYAPPIPRYIPLGQISYFGLAASNVYDQNCRSFVFLAQQIIF